MKARIYHAKNPTFGFGKKPVFPTEYDMVAELEVPQLDQNDAIEDAFRLTNHIDCDWTLNEEVKSRAKKSLRSTSVGDVIELEDGSRWYCENMGWTKL